MKIIIIIVVIFVVLGIIGNLLPKDDSNDRRWTDPDFFKNPQPQPQTDPVKTLINNALLEGSSMYEIASGYISHLLENYPIIKDSSGKTLIVTGVRSLNREYLNSPYVFQDKYLDKLMIIKDTVAAVYPDGDTDIIELGDGEYYNVTGGTLSHKNIVKCIVSNISNEQMKKIRPGHMVCLVGTLMGEYYKRYSSCDFVLDSYAFAHVDGADSLRDTVYFDSTILGLYLKNKGYDISDPAILEKIKKYSFTGSFSDD